MIVSVGTDMVDIRRIERTLERFGERFILRVYTEAERARAERRPATRFGSYAKRWAAKEACAKALGTGISRGVRWRDMGVVNDPSGAPTMRLTGGAAERLGAVTPPGHVARIHVSLTDEFPYAFSFVMISAELADTESSLGQGFEPSSGPNARNR
jgi:holo-[acyl-carrier protein] synthase